MPIETFGFLDSLNSSNPPTSDGLVGGDDHLRGIKATLRATFPGVNAAATRVLGSSYGFMAGGVAGSPSYSFLSNPGIGFSDNGSSTIGTYGSLSIGENFTVVGGAAFLSGFSADGTSTFVAANFGSGAVSIGSAGVHTSALTVDGAGTFGTSVSAPTITGGTIVGAMAAGFISDFGGASAPSGWIVCDGAAFSVSAEPQLFAAIGYTWGGSGSTFNVPNLQSRFRRHRDGGTLSGSVGNLQGPANLTHNHGVSGSTDTDNFSHSHGVDITSGAMSANATHAHTTHEFLTSVQNGGGTNQGNLLNTSGGVGVDMSSSTADLSHTHRVLGDTGSVTHNHSHSFNVTSGASGDANEARPYSATVLTCIKRYN